jgi:hypothetical protein
VISKKLYILIHVADDSDEPSGLVRHLPRRLLGVQAEKRKRKRAAIGNKVTRVEADSDSEDEQQAEASVGQWSRKNPEKLGTNIPAFIKPVLSVADSDRLGGLNNAYDYYKLFQSDSFVSEIVYQSKLYAVQKGYQKSVDQINSNTYRLA